MILETLLGGLGGGLLRLAPEVMKVLDAKNVRKHELDMTTLSIEADKVKAANAIAIQQSENEGVFTASSLQALIESIKAQATVTGVKWVDAASSLVRPSVTYALFGLYTACRVATFFTAVHAGTPAIEVLRATWTDEDQILLAGILNFWFLNRTIEKYSK